jgi:hypothetical protein
LLSAASSFNRFRTASSQEGASGFKTLGLSYSGHEGREAPLAGGEGGAAGLHAGTELQGQQGEEGLSTQPWGRTQVLSSGYTGDSSLVSGGSSAV